MIAIRLSLSPLYCQSFPVLCHFSVPAMLPGYLLLVLLPFTVADFTIDNEIVGEPMVDCEDSLVGLTFKTKKPFTGRVYVQARTNVVTGYILFSGTVRR